MHSHSMRHIRRVLRRVLAPAACLLAVSMSASIPATASDGQTTSSTREASVTAQALAEQIAEEGVAVSNASVTGRDVQLGTVSGLPGHGHAVTDGVALTTGSLIDPDPQADSDVDFEMSSVLGPNKKLTTTGDLGGPGEEGLSSLAGEDTYDAATLSFDVTATASTMVLLYEFGSEEYAGEGGSGAGNPNKGSWQSQGFKDVVRIDVNGTNCALVPGTQTPVNAGTVNEATNAGYYNPNISGHQLGGIDVAFNGYTSALVCQAAVTPGETVRVSISIADTRDGQLDSTLLLATDSLGFTDSLPKDPCSAYGGNCQVPEPSPTGSAAPTDQASATASAAGTPGAGGTEAGSAQAGDAGDAGGAGNTGNAVRTGTAGDSVAASGGAYAADTAQARPALAQAGSQSLPWLIGASVLVLAGGTLMLRRRRLG